MNPGHGMNYHSHERRSEVWTVISGIGSVVIDGVERVVAAGDVIDLPVGCKHTVKTSDSGLQIIEVQMGREISVGDKIKHNNQLGSYYCQFIPWTNTHYALI